MYLVTVDWAPAYELVISLKAFLSTPEHKTMELGAAWARGVRQRLTPAFLNDLYTWKAETHTPDLPDVVVRHCPGDRTAPEFLEWLAGVPAGQLYEWLDPLVPHKDAMRLGDLGGTRDRYVTILQGWHREYFSSIDSAILHGLERDADAKRQLLQSATPEEVVEIATNGLVLSADTDIAEVLLVPQYHFRPWNLNDYYRRMRLIEYPVDALPIAPDEIPPHLRRLTKALSDESRLRILRLLSNEPATFSDVVRAMDISKSTVNHHLVILRAAGLVRVQDDGMHASTYTLQRSGVEGLTKEIRAYLWHE